MRTSLARSLVLQPDVFLFDEPFGALDEMTRERLNDELLALFADRGFAALFITHSVAEAVFLSTRVVVMSPRPGRILGDVSVPFGYPREPELRYSDEFGKVAGEVSDLLRERAAAAGPVTERPACADAGVLGLADRRRGRVRPPGRLRQGHVGGRAELGRLEHPGVRAAAAARRGRPGHGRARLRHGVLLRLAGPARRPPGRRGRLGPAAGAGPGRCSRSTALDFPLVHADAEQVPYPDGSFDLALSEYGASSWCDPHGWVPEAARLLRPGGWLVFLTASVSNRLPSSCAPRSRSMTPSAASRVVSPAWLPSFRAAGRAPVKTSRQSSRRFCRMRKVSIAQGSRHE